MIFYLIRHRASGTFMPQMKHGRGYTHWNPGNPTAQAISAVNDLPRLLKSPQQARRVIQLWAQFPTWHTRRVELDMSYEENFKTKPDGRQATDLEVVQATLTLAEDETWNGNGHDSHAQPVEA